MALRRLLCHELHHGTPNQILTSYCLQKCGQQQLISLDTSSGALTEGPLVKGGLYKVHDPNLQSPGATAILLQTHRNVYSIVDLSSLHVRGSLSRPLSLQTVPNPYPTWQAWTTAGLTITLVWTSDSRKTGTQVTVMDAATCQILRRTSIAFCPGMGRSNDLHITCALASDTQRLAVALFDQRGPRCWLRVAFVSLIHGVHLIMHDIEGIDALCLPQLTASPSGAFLAVMLRPLYQGIGDAEPAIV